MKQQRGLVLLALIIALLLVAFAMLLAQLNWRRAPPAQLALQELHSAKQALLAYAVSEQERYNKNFINIRIGELPCPDYDQDGIINPVYDYVGKYCKTHLGFLPYRSLGLPPSSQPIWYALSPNFANNSGNAQESQLNPDTPSMLTVDGRTVVAVLVHAGPPLAAQTRQSSDSSDARSQYLELANANSDFNNFISGPTNANFNDVLLTITATELWNKVIDKVLARLGVELNAQYKIMQAYPDAASSAGAKCQQVGDYLPGECSYNGKLFKLPTASATGAVDYWLYRNNWLQFLRYKKIDADNAELSPRGAQFAKSYIRLTKGERI